MATGYPLCFRVNDKFMDFALDPDGPPKTWRVRLTSGAFINNGSGGTTGTATLTYNFPPNVKIDKVFISLITPFAGGSVSAATVSVGIAGGSATAYLAATNVFTGATASGAVTIGAGGSLGNFAGGNATPSAVGGITAVLTTTTDTVNHLTAGALDLFVQVTANSVRTATNLKGD